MASVAYGTGGALSPIGPVGPAPSAHAWLAYRQQAPQLVAWLRRAKQPPLSSGPCSTAQPSRNATPGGRKFRPFGSPSVPPDAFGAAAWPLCRCAAFGRPCGGRGGREDPGVQRQDHGSHAGRGPRAAQALHPVTTLNPLAPRRFLAWRVPETSRSPSKACTGAGGASGLRRIHPPKYSSIYLKEGGRTPRAGTCISCGNL